MSHRNLLIIFTRNPVLGKVKTRLAKTVGDKTALDIYHFLLQKTKEVTNKISCDKKVYYSEKIIEDDLWDQSIYQKREQYGNDLGEKMKNAFNDSFKNNYEKIIVIGSDLFDLEPSHINEAFKKLNHNNVVIGPALDGGYYLIGLKKLHPKIFQNKNWGTSSVRKETLKNLEKVDVHLLPMLNDVDVIEDIKNHSAFTKFLKPR
ncbi:TIGR04282 family arsenosugar biosynthesis glycosyltransferase [Flavobacteriaceae bacterium]|nr:TIGR04282 family arsenosugar biosynthesis glycosyltransferase [Flavobacteriaceae bacterium]